MAEKLSGPAWPKSLAQYDPKNDRRRSGLHEQGRILFERGGLNSERLKDEAQVELEEDYEVCVRMRSRARDQKQQKPTQARAKPARISQESLF